MSDTPPNYSLAGVGACKSVIVEIDRAADESHFEVVITTADFYLRLRMPNLDPAESVLEFLSACMGKNECQELAIPLSASSRLTLVKDPEFIDRFFLKLHADSVFVEYTLSGLTGSSLMEALLTALREAKSE